MACGILRPAMDCLMPSTKEGTSWGWAWITYRIFRTFRIAGFF